jgi:hypothetical protein
MTRAISAHALGARGLAFLWTVVCACASLDVVAAQNVWRVNVAGGPSAHFTDLPPAVAAAQPGDTILCWLEANQTVPGWGGYTAPLIDKPIRLIGLTTMSASLPGITTRVNIDGVIHVRNIALGETCVVSNVYLTTTFKTATQGIRCEDCAGSVVLDGVTFFNSGYVIELLRVERCANVLMQGAMCTLGATGWFVADSNLAIQRSQFWVSAGAFALPGLPPVATTSFAPLYLLRSTATLSNCTLRGHPGNIPPHVIGPGRPAVLLESSTVNIGPYTTLSQQVSSPAGLGAINPPMCLVRRDPRTVIVTQWASTGMPVIHGPIHSSATSFSVVAKEPYTVWVDGPASGFALLGFDHLLPAPVPTPLGELWLDPFRYTPVAILALAAGTGQGSWSTTCPASAPVDIPFVFQSLTLAPDGTLAATLPSPFTVGWEYYRIP